MTVARAEQSRAEEQQQEQQQVSRRGWSWSGGKARQTREQVQDLASSSGESHPVSLSRAYVEFGLFVLTAAGGRELESFGKLKGGWCGAMAGREGGQGATSSSTTGFRRAATLLCAKKHRRLVHPRTRTKNAPSAAKSTFHACRGTFFSQKILLGRENFLFPQLTLDLHFVLCHTTVQSLIHDSGAILNAKLYSFLIGDIKQTLSS